MGLLNKIIINPRFLTGMKDTAGKLGIESTDATSIGNTILPAVKSIMNVIAIIAAVVAVSLIAISLIVSRRQEDRSESMKRLLYVGGGLLLLSLASGLVGYVVSLAA